MQNLITGFIMLALTICLYIVYLRKNKSKLNKILRKGTNNLTKNSIRIFAIFLIIGILQNFLTKESVGGFLLKFSGIKGIFAGIAVGSIMMGPIATGYPICSYLLQNGATISLISSFLAAWVMIGFISISLEFRYFGWKFTVVRNIFALISIIVISLLMEAII